MGWVVYEISGSGALLAAAVSLAFGAALALAATAAGAIIAMLILSPRLRELRLE